MRKELTDYLINRYPKIFNPRFIFECEDGWFTLIDSAVSNIQGHIGYNHSIYNKNQLYLNLIEQGKTEDLPPYIQKQLQNNIPLDAVLKCPWFKAHQVKQKFGVMNFYHEGGDEYCTGIISMAQSMSEKTCEQCGNRGNLYSKSNWLSTLCETHAVGFKYSPMMMTKTDEVVNALVNHEYQFLTIVQEISHDEIIAVNKQQQTVNVKKIETPQLTYWHGEIGE